MLLAEEDHLHRCLEWEPLTKASNQGGFPPDARIDDDPDYGSCQLSLECFDAPQIPSAIRNASPQTSRFAKQRGNPEPERNGPAGFYLVFTGRLTRLAAKMSHPLQTKLNRSHGTTTEPEQH